MVSLIKRGFKLEILSISRPESPYQEETEIVRLPKPNYINSDGSNITKFIKMIYHLVILSIKKPKRFLIVIKVLLARRTYGLSINHIFAYLQILRISPDVIHAHFGHSGVFISDIYQLLDTPVVVSFYGQDYSQDLPKRRDVYERMFSKVDKITAMNQFMQDALINYGCPKEKIKIVRIWAKDSFARPVKHIEKRSINSSTIKILSVGRLTHKKGYFLCLEAIAKIKKERKNIIYEIIGEGPLEEEIKKYSRKNSLNDVVHFIGAVNREKVKSYMMECDILLLHSITSIDGDMEGTPTVILEVGLLGKPVVSTYHAGIPEIIDHGISGYLTNEGDIDQTVESLRDLIDNGKNRILFGKMLKKKIMNEYSEDLNCTKFINIYRSIVE